MKKLLNTILIVNTIYVMACADNQDVTVFFLPDCIYLVAGFLRINVRKFNSLLNL
ncbi:hypothetical protein [Chryseobacterium aquaticum]|uniref:hypothetical protein n=1 Tax=Chryseobacterium aquaticum TaxID=452084 RepID=UPI0013F4D7E8|nr:hypothetical protein [Chryseobacterium aquaticum]